MKIAILGSRGIPAHYGGFETFAEKLAVALQDRGIDVTVFCESGKLTMPEVYRGVRLRHVPAPSLGPLSTIIYDLRCLWEARRGYDVVYMLGYGSALFCVIPRLWRTEVWINPDGLEWARAKWNFVAKSYFRFMEWVSLYAADRIIADSKAIAATLAARHRRMPPYTVIAYGCEVIETNPSVDPLSEWDVRAAGYYLVICRLEPENHILEILQAFSASRSNKQLVVVGNHLAKTPYGAKLRSVADLRIRMIGTVYDQAKLICLRYHSFAYLHGHSVGGTNPSLLEAMGCGNLILAHDNPFNRETLGLCGLYFADATELTQLIDCTERGENEQAQLRAGSEGQRKVSTIVGRILSPVTWLC